MLRSERFTPWVLPIRSGNHLIGSGFVVSKHAIATALHVLTQAGVSSKDVWVRPDVHVGSGVTQAAFRCLVTDSANDLAILETDRAWSDLASLVVGLGPLAGILPDSKITSVGYRERWNRELEIGDAPVPVDRYPNPFDPVGSGASAQIDRFRAEMPVPAGFSGGPLVITGHPASPVLGVNLMGGERSPYAVFAPSDAVIALMCRAGIAPRSVVEWDSISVRSSASACGALGATDRVERWKRLLNLPSSRVTFTFNVRGRQVEETFRLVPPPRNGSSEGAHEPLLMQESLICGALCGASPDTGSIHCGLSPRNALRFTQDLGAYYGMPFRLPTYAEWHNALTADGADAFPPYQPRESWFTGTVSRRSPRSTWGLRLPPWGLFELLLDSATASAATRAYAAGKERSNAAVSFKVADDEGVPSVSFRLLLPALTPLASLKPRWEEE